MNGVRKGRRRVGFVFRNLYFARLRLHLGAGAHDELAALGLLARPEVTARWEPTAPGHRQARAA